MKKFVSIILCLAIIFSSAMGSAAAISENEVDRIFQKTGDYIYRTVKEPSFGSIGGEWVMYGLGIADYPMSDSYIKGYQKTVEKVVKESKGVLHRRKYTEYSRLLVSYAALGLDPTNVAGYSMVDPLCEFDDVIWQGPNGSIWALIALDRTGWKFSKSAKKNAKNLTTRQKLIDEILKNQLSDGGWAFAGERRDPDMTGMALIALAPHRYESSKIKKAVSRGIQAMSEMQEASGAYSTWGAETSESCAQIICALSYLGINPMTDKRFTKKGNTVMDGMIGFYDEKVSGFRHVNHAHDGYKAEVNQMATEQAYYALAIYKSIFPEKIKGLKTSRSGDGIKISFDKDRRADGYQIKISTDSSFKKNVKSVAGAKNIATVKGLASGIGYYVKVRGYKKINGSKAYGSYSEVSEIKTGIAN